MTKFTKDYIAKREKVCEQTIIRDWPGKGFAEAEKKALREIVRLQERIAALEKDKEQLRTAILWALGMLDDFPERKPGQGAYWWRTELQKRAGIDAAKEDV